MGGVRHSREQWLSWVVAQGSSGATVAGFCESVEIKENSFYRWRARLLADPPVGAGQRGSASVSAGRQGSAFVPLSIVASASERIEIDLPCGATVRVPAADDAVTCVLRVLIDTGREESGESGWTC